MATENEYVDLFFEMPDNNNNNNNNNNNENDNEKLPIDLFQLLNVELNDTLFHNYDGELDDETDGPIQFMQNIVKNVKRDFEGIVESNERKIFLCILTKVFATLLNVKVDNIEKIINIIKISLSSVIKSWSEQN